MSTRHLLAQRKAALVSRSERERQRLQLAVYGVRASIAGEAAGISMRAGRLLLRLATVAADAGVLGKTARVAGLLLGVVRALRAWRSTAKDRPEASPPAPR